MIVTFEKLALPVSEAARSLSISRTTLYALIKQGRLSRVKCGKRTLIPMSSLERFLDNLPSEGGK